MNLFYTLLGVYVSKRTLGPGPTVVGVLCGVLMLVLLTASLVLSGGTHASRRGSQAGKSSSSSEGALRNSSAELVGRLQPTGSP